MKCKLGSRARDYRIERSYVPVPNLEYAIQSSKIIAKSFQSIPLAQISGDTMSLTCSPFLFPWIGENYLFYIPSRDQSTARRNVLSKCQSRQSRCLLSSRRFYATLWHLPQPNCSTRGKVTGGFNIDYQSDMNPLGREGILPISAIRPGLFQP